MSRHSWPIRSSFLQGTENSLSCFVDFRLAAICASEAGRASLRHTPMPTQRGHPPFEVFGPDTSKTVKHGTVTTALALRNLRVFLDATGWSCLYGLNLGQGTKENAAVEAAAVFRVLGPRLVAFQIGNEPDSFRNRYRPATWGPADYIAEWNTFHDAIVATTPAAKFAGPDISNKLPFLAAFADEAHKHRDVILLTAHYYAMGPAGSPGATLDQLAEPDPKQATMHAAGFDAVAQAMKTSGLPFRMSEGNSCWNGGQPGVSDTLVSALWCADVMLRFAELGWCGVNLHGGGSGVYTPIAGAPSTGFTRRPEYFGMQFAQSLRGYKPVAGKTDWRWTPCDRVCGGEGSAAAGRDHQQGQ